MEETNETQKEQKTIYENPLVYIGGALFFCMMAAQAPYGGINESNLNYILLSTVLNYIWFAFVALIIFGVTLALGKNKTLARYLKIFCWTTFLLTAAAVQIANNQRSKKSTVSFLYNRQQVFENYSV